MTDTDHTAEIVKAAETRYDLLINEAPAYEIMLANGRINDAVQAKRAAEQPTLLTAEEAMAIRNNLLASGCSSESAAQTVLDTAHARAAKVVDKALADDGCLDTPATLRARAIVARALGQHP